VVALLISRLDPGLRFQKEMELNYRILIQGGVGDAITRLARLNSLLSSEDDRAEFEIYAPFTWRPSEVLIRELISKDPRILSRKGRVDRILDWRPKFDQLAWPLQIPFEVTCPRESLRFAESICSESSKNCVIHPITANGNARGFERDRYWDFKKWQFVIDFLKEQEYQVLRIGGKRDLFPFSDITDYCGKLSLFQSIALILKSGLMIGTNSWPIEVSGYSLKPTISFWFTDPEGIISHFDLDHAEKFPNVRFVQDRNISVDEIIQIIEALEDECFVRT
jgi:ADP-heptose:LPS heptosyltransferase